MVMNYLSIKTCITQMCCIVQRRCDGLVKHTSFPINGAEHAKHKKKEKKCRNEKRLLAEPLTFALVKMVGDASFELAPPTM